MISAWVLRSLIAGVLVCGAAIAADRVAAWYRTPRRWIWVVAMAVSVVVPAVAYFAPGVMPAFGIEAARSAQFGQSVVVPLDANLAPVPLASAEDAFALPPVRWPVTAIAWLICTLALGAVVFAVTRRLRHLRVRAAASVIDGFAVRVTESFGPAVVGLRHPEIVVPRWIMDVPDADRHLMLSHEREHIDGGDQWLLAGAALGVVAMPWNVLLWWQYARLRFVVEADCDARVLARGADARAYGRTLLRAALPHPMSMLAPVWGAKGGELAQRIHAMTAPAPRSRTLRALPMVLVTAGLVAIACDVTQPDPAVRAESATSEATDALAEPTATLIGDTIGFFSLRSGHVRITGYTREQMPARVRLTQGGGKLRLVSESVVLRTVGDSVIELITPAVLRVEAAQYALVVEAIEIGTEVEIAGTAPLGFGSPQAGSARGPAPMLNFTKPHVPLESGAPVGFSDQSALVPDVVVAAPGTIELYSATSTPEWVRVTFGEGVSQITMKSGRVHTLSDGKKILEVETPATLKLSSDEYFVRFEPLRRGAILRAAAVNNLGARFRGQYPVPFVLCGTVGYATVRGADGGQDTAADCRR